MASHLNGQTHSSQLSSDYFQNELREDGFWDTVEGRILPLLQHQVKSRGGRDVECVYLWSHVCNRPKNNASKKCNFQMDPKLWHVVLAYLSETWAAVWVYPWYSTKYFTPLKKWYWITYQCKKVYFPDTFGMRSSNELFCAKPPSTLKPLYLTRHQQEEASCDSSKCSCFVKWLLHQNHW